MKHAGEAGTFFFCLSCCCCCCCHSCQFVQKERSLLLSLDSLSLFISLYTQSCCFPSFFLSLSLSLFFILLSYTKTSQTQWDTLETPPRQGKHKHNAATTTTLCGNTNTYGAGSNNNIANEKTKPFCARRLCLSLSLNIFSRSSFFFFDFGLAWLDCKVKQSKQKWKRKMK